TSSARGDVDGIEQRADFSTWIGDHFVVISVVRHEEHCWSPQSVRLLGSRQTCLQSHTGNDGNGGEKATIPGFHSVLSVVVNGVAQNVLTRVLRHDSQ